MKFVLSDGSVNSYGFRLDMDRIDITRFKSNPVMLYNHYELIGKWKNIELQDGVLTAEPEFIDGEDEKTALKVKNRVEKGFLKGASLGIRILETVKKAGEAPTVVAEVMEASIVDIPSNRNALALYDKEGNRLEGEAFELALNKISKPIKSNMNMEKLQLSAKIAQLLGISQDADLQALEKAVGKLSEERNKLRQELEALQAEKVNDLIETALKEGRITASQKEKFLKLAQSDYDLAKDTLEALPKAEKLTGKEKPGENLDERSDWTFADWRKKDTAGLLRIKKEDPERYAEILNKH